MPLVLLAFLTGCGVVNQVARRDTSGGDDTAPVDTNTDTDTAPVDSGGTDTSTTTSPTAAEIAATNDKDGDFFLDTNTAQADLDTIIKSNDPDLLSKYHYSKIKQDDGTFTQQFYLDCDDTDPVQNAWQRSNGVDTDCNNDVNPTDKDALIIDVGVYDGVKAGSAKVFGDFDGDGKEDLAVASGWEGAVYIFLGKSGLINHPNHLNAQEDADVVFQDTTSTGTGFGTDLQKVDLNGDGKDDLIVGVGALNSLGQGDNTNSGGVVGIYGQSAFADTEFNNSNLMDPTWVGAHNMFTIKGWTNASAGDFVHLLGDIDGTGNQNIVMGEGQHCYSFPATAYTGVQQIDSMYAQDANNDGFPDYNMHYFNNTDGSPDSGNFCEHMVSGDITRDGVDELVVADSEDVQNDGKGEIIIAQGGTIPKQVNFFSPIFPVFYERGNGTNYGAGENLGLNDLDGDGYPDLTVGVPMENNIAGTIYITPGNNLASIFDGTNPDFSVGGTAILDGDVTKMHGIKIYETNEGAGLGLGFASNSDSNGDGIDDLTAGAGAYSVDGIVQGQAYYFNNASLSTITQGTSLTEEEASISTDNADQTIASAESTGLGEYVVGGGDLDGDGTGDVAMSDVTFDNSKGRVYAYFGGKSE